ncbi:MAG: PAS domain-containing sensor histidine kinase [Planctomycetes bacterium]|nr:PAS domain-containing sensor histidine kinase [Planctomycetota bacterium]
MKCTLLVATGTMVVLVGCCLGDEVSAGSWGCCVVMLASVSANVVLGRSNARLREQQRADRGQLLQVTEERDRARSEEASWRQRQNERTRVLSSVLEDLKRERRRLRREIAVRTVLQRKNDILSQRVYHAVEAAPNGMLLLSATGEILMANTNVEKTFGYEREQLLGKRLAMLFPDQHVSMPPVEGESDDDNARRDLIGRCSDGSEVPIECGLTPLETHEGLFVIAALVDITERKRVHDELCQRNAEMEQLLHVVSHDLKSPLVTVEGYTGILQRHAQAGDLDKVIEAAGRIHRGAQTMSRLIDDLLELSRVGSQPLVATPVDLAGVVGQVTELLESALEAAGAQLRLDTEPVTLHADEGQLVRVLLNLVGNAIKYGCPEPGSTIRVGAISHAGETQVFVHDEGPGVPTAYRERIFRLFQRHDRRPGGTGVGLATVATVMHRHGGRAWVEDGDGGGACFWIAFPTPAATRLELAEPAGVQS